MIPPQVIGKHPKASHRTLAALGHAMFIPSAWLTMGLGAFLGPLLWWALFRRASPLVDYHARFSLNAAISFSVLAWLLEGLAWLRPQSQLPLFVLLCIAGAAWLGMILRRAVRALRAKDLRQPRFSWVG